MKRSEILREAMKFLAVDSNDFFRRIKTTEGICGAVWQVSGDYAAAKWLFNNGKGGRTKFDDAYWIPIFTPESYTARIMLLELGAILSEEEGQ